MVEIKLSEALARGLINLGIKRIYGVIGTTVLNFYDALYEYKNEIKQITVRKENVAISAADAEYRTTKKPAAAVVHAGGGFLNSLTGLGIAMKDRSRLLLITGSVKRRLKNTDSWLEVDQEGLSKALNLYHYYVESPDVFVEKFEKAMIDLFYGNPKPVVLEIPEDIWDKKINIDENNFPNISYEKEENVNEEDVKRVKEEILKSNKPLILVSNEVNFENSRSYIYELSEITDSYILTTGNARGICEEDHPRCIGRVGYGGGSLYADNALKSTDYLLVFGEGFDDITTYGFNLTPSESIVVISNDPSSELRPSYYETIKADPLVFLKELVNQLKRDTKNKKINDQWKKEIEKYKNDWDNLIKQTLKRKYRDAVNPALFFSKLNDALKRNRIIIGGQGTHVLYTYDYMKVYEFGGFMAATNLGSMGFALPAAIGAKISNPDREVIAIIGDGEALMSIEALQTIKDENLDVKIIIVNDNSYRVLYLKQLINKSNRIYGTELNNPDFAKLAESFGIRGIKISRDEEIDNSIKEILANGPIVVDLITSRDDMPPTNTEMVLKMDQT
ncbi:thiamine pyrophosphate-dependent enzyme, possible carboligase or decarboxylase [Caldisphaera lagunensis DSM 15908]|uniref:2-oxoacid oxidoreductase (ferredoxin) n=1 Tax=Caldisphaera lagunensis (strain DSM 15908 / JCM 11604 / ANMR 0165 / IC-154) TaxID=1056495 RepID=L0A802_CALLD|nr:thiamine pyrophosphate-binding protein [Caldisphaera lagunensis]AFZ69961.1 thiamine pyrophosphate-dependent enzyme, possible carboligase or decarboxylase [Caldisphaera lagunensis DSM 15908]